MPRFDEVELETSPMPLDDSGAASEVDARDAAPRLRRLFAVVTDISFFAALTLALLPLLPADTRLLLPKVALAGFVTVVSFYYFCGCWLLWGKTVGGAIFDVKVVSDGNQMTFRQASMRWIGMIASFATAGLGFLLALLPSRRSLPDLLSHTRCTPAN